MKKVLKVSFIIFLAFLTLGIGGCFFVSKKLPVGVKSSKTDTMIQTMNEALNKAAWDSTRYVKWTFQDNHHYVWDKDENLAQVSWKDNRVLLDPDEVTGVAYAQNVKQSGKDAEKLVKKAWGFWCNDMFWLIAPFKVNDPGVTHELVEDENGERLKVTYNSGGVTPGDSYVWSFDEEGRPKEYEMYVGVFPIKGISVPWENWKKITSGALISTAHGPMLSMEGVQGGMELSDVGLTNDIWAEIR